MIRGIKKPSGCSGCCRSQVIINALVKIKPTGGATRLATRRRLTQKAYARTAAYDAAIY